MVDMNFDAITVDVVGKFERQIAHAKLLFVDGNAKVDTLRAICKLAAKYNVPGMVALSWLMY